MTVHASGTDNVSSPVLCTADQFQTAETTGAVFNGSCTNDAGLTAAATPLTVKLDKTPPSAGLAITGGTLGAHGWYISDVSVQTSGTDSISSPVTCTADQVFSTDSANQVANGSCTNNAGLVGNAAPISFKLDKTPPSATLAVTAGTPGANGWYISDVTVSTSGSDNVSNPVSCTADQYQTTETTGAVFNGSCTNDAGLTAAATSLAVKLDKTPPTGVVLVPSGTLGLNGWYVSNVSIHASGTDSISSPVVCTPDQSQTTDSTGTAFYGSCTNNAGLTTNAAALTVKRDATPPVVNVTGVSNGATYTLGAVPTAACTTSDATSGVATFASLNVTGGVAPGVGSFTAKCSSAADNAGNPQSAAVTVTYSVLYASGGMCLGDAGHQILQPVNADGTSTFKQGSTVPAKFRVCDALGNSIGTAGVVSSFFYGAVTGTITPVVDEAVDSTTPDTAFRWDPTARQWIFNISTKPLSVHSTYIYQINLNDGSKINFQYGLPK